jgi:monofunctional biosynthetic peptidoglycan transglycosylase
MAETGKTDKLETPARAGLYRPSWARRAALAAVVVIAAPFVLTLCYAVLPPPASSLMIQRLATGEGIDYRWVPLHWISPELTRAVITAEDARFCRHHGIDWAAFREVAKEAIDGDGRPARGASTIAMQTAKNLFLWEGRSVVRKVLELPLAIWIDTVWSKRRLIEVYLNIAEWAPGVYGAEAAAQRHFGKSTDKLSKREAALLAAVLPNPIVRRAGKPSNSVRRKAQVIAQRASAMGPLLDCVEP